MQGRHSLRTTMSHWCRRLSTCWWKSVVPDQHREGIRDAVD